MCCAKKEDDDDDDVTINFYDVLRLPDVVKRNRSSFSAAAMTSRVVVIATLADGVMTSLGVRVKKTDCDQVRS